MTTQDNIAVMMHDIGQNARDAAMVLASAPSEAKQKALEVAADTVWATRAEIVAANKKDLAFGAEKGLSPAMMDRLMLDEDRIQSMVDGLRAVAAQDDPIGSVIEA